MLRADIRIEKSIKGRTYESILEGHVTGAHPATNQLITFSWNFSCTLSTRESFAVSSTLAGHLITRVEMLAQPITWLNTCRHVVMTTY